MQLKRLLTFSLVFVLLALVPLNSPGFVSNPSDISNDALTSGEINGVSYSYGDISYEESGNQTIVNEGSMSEFRNITRTEVRNVSLIISSELKEIYFHIKQLEETEAANITKDIWKDQAGLQQWFDIINNTIPFKFDPDRETGWAMMDIYIEENFTIAMASSITDDWRFLGEFPVNTTYFEYNDLILGEVVRVSGIIIPEVFVSHLTEKEYELEVTNMKVTQAFMAFFSVFSRVYNVSATAHQVNITNGVNLAINVNMFDTISANYTEYAATYLQYFFLSIDYTKLKFTNNDSTVDWQFYPRHMLPVLATSTGTIIEAGYRQVETKLLSTFQAITAAFAIVEDTSTEETTSIEARLAVWGIQSMTSMVAFDDANNNDKLDLNLDENGIGVASQDRVSYIGLAEAYESKEFTAYYRSHVYNETLVMLGYGVNITNTNMNQTDTFFNYEEFGFGDVDAASANTFSWTDPVEHDNGVVEFNFGVSYTNFPVTWVNMTNVDNSVIDYEDIAYHYRVLVDPTTGWASISPTWTYGGVVDAGLANAVSDLSLALILKSEFFAIQATYTATESNETVNATETSAFGVLGVKIGGDAATEIDVTGPKQYYTLGGTSNETASFDAITLIQVAGHFEAERTSPFNSESGNTAGTSSLSLVETLEVDFYYAAHLIVVTYPAWGGDSIVHDPDFNVNYDAPDVEEPVDDDTTTTTTTPVAPITTTAVDPATTTPLPGFTIWMSIISIGVAVVFVRKSKY